MLKRFTAASLGICLLAACSPVDPPMDPTVAVTSPSPSGNSSSPGDDDAPQTVFYGTLQEYNDARMACVERYGLVVVPGPPNDSPSFGVSSEGVGQDRVDEVLLACDAEVGTFYTPPATEESVTAQYQWLVGQYRCLVAAGFPAEEPPSLQFVVDQWKTKGHFQYDPMSSLMEQYDAALAACPRTTQEWPG